VERTDTGLRLTPLPSSPRFSARLNLAAMGLQGRTVTAVTAVGGDGQRESIESAKGDGGVGLSHDGQAFCYEIAL